MYRIAILPYGLFKNERVLIKYNKQLKWHLIKEKKESDGSVFVIVKGISSKKRLLRLAKDNNWIVI